MARVHAGEARGQGEALDPRARILETRDARLEFVQRGRLARLEEVVLYHREAGRRAVEPIAGDDRLAAACETRGSIRAQARLDECPQQREIRDRARHRADMVEVPAHRDDAVERPRVPCTLEARDPAEARGARDRPPGLGAERGQAHPARDRRRAAGARPAGGAIEIPGVARARRILARELGGLGLAENDRAEVAENLHYRGIAFRQVAGAQGRSRPRRQSGGVDDVLHPDRNAEQRQSARLLARQLGLPGRGASRTVRVNLDPSSDLGLRRFYPLHAFPEHVHRSELARPQGTCRLDQATGFADGHLRRFQSIHELDSITTDLHPEPPPTTCEPMLHHSDDDDRPASYPLKFGATAAMSERTASREFRRDRRRLPTCFGHASRRPARIAGLNREFTAPARNSLRGPRSGTPDRHLSRPPRFPVVGPTAGTAQYMLAQSASGGSTRVDGDRGSRPSKGRCPALGREGAVRGRPVLPRTVGGGVRAKPPRPCPHPVDHRPRAPCGPCVHRRRHGRRAPDPGRIQPALVQVLRLPATRPGQGALRRRMRRTVHCSDPGAGRGHRRGGGARFGGAAGGHRQPRGAPPGRPPGARRVGRQPLPHHLGRRRLRVGQEVRRSGHRTRVPNRASMHGADGGQGGTRHAGRAQGPARRVHLHPGSASHPHRALPVPRA